MLGLEEGCESIQLVVPESALILEPSHGIDEWCGHQPAVPLATHLRALDEPRAFEHAQMFGHRRQRHVEGLGNGARRLHAVGQAHEYLPPRGIGQGAEYRIELGRSCGDHGQKVLDANSVE